MATSNPKGVKNKTSANKFNPPSGREHPPSAKNASVGGVHGASAGPVTVGGVKGRKR